MTAQVFGSLKQATLGNTLSMTNNWGNDGRLASRRLYKTTGGTNLSLLSYSYDNDDNITGITDGVNAANNVTYAYDVRGRLAQLTLAVTSGAPYKRTDWSFDANGNRTAVERRVNASDTVPAQSDTYTNAPGSNRLASLTSVSGTRQFTPDARGNTISETRPGGITVSAGYDGHGRLISYAQSGSISLAHAYNGLGDRTATTATPAGGSADTRRFVTDPGGRVLAEYGTSATDVKAEFIWLSPTVGGSGPFGGDDGLGGYMPIALVTGTTLSWVHGDHMGTPIVMTDATGTSIAQPGGYYATAFPGQTRTLADLYYNRYRDYDPTTGRYIQADPIGLAGGPSPYSYAMNNPLRYTDPTGEFVPLAIAGGMVLGAGSGAISDLLIQAGFNALQGRDVWDTNCYDWDSVRNSALLGAVSGASGTLGRFVSNRHYENLLEIVQKTYPKLAGKFDLHHITPRYLGGAADGPLSRLDRAYHQQITNAFRNEHAYGQPAPNAARLKEIMKDVYRKFPLPPGY